MIRKVEKSLRKCFESLLVKMAGFIEKFSSKIYIQCQQTAGETEDPIGRRRFCLHILFSNANYLL